MYRFTITLAHIILCIETTYQLENIIRAGL